MTELSDEDIAAAREQGDVVALILMASGLPVKRSKPEPAAPAPSPPQLRRARPGAWPEGTRAPGPTPEVAAYLAQLYPGRYRPTTEENP